MPGQISPVAIRYAHGRYYVWDVDGSEPWGSFDTRREAMDCIIDTLLLRANPRAVDRWNEGMLEMMPQA